MILTPVALAIGALFIAQVDPVGDAPPPLLDVPVPAPAPPPPVRPGLLVLPVAALAVDDESAAFVSARLKRSLATTWRVIDGEALSSHELVSLEACAGLNCLEPMSKLGADAVLMSTVAPLGGELSLTITLKTGDGPHRAMATGPATALDALVDDAVAKLHPTTAPPIALGHPTTPAPNTETPSPPSTTTPAAPTAPSPTAPPPPSPSTAGTSPSSESVSPFSTKGPKSSPPITMLLVAYGAALAPVIGAPLFLPVVQGLLLSSFGPDLVGVEYPGWWMGTLAGYGVYFVGFSVGLSMYVGGFLLSNNDPGLGLTLILGGAATVLVTSLVEPLVFYAVASWDAEVPRAPDDRRRAQRVRPASPSLPASTSLTLPDAVVGGLGGFE
jgi:hypothetical protein